MTSAPTRTRLADDPQMPPLGSVVGQRYEVRDVLGEGGFAVVYAAYDARTKAQVAIKVLDPIMSRRPEFASRFMREVETVSRLRHHNTISIFDAGETPNGCLYLVMELLEGQPLDTLLEREGALPPDRVRSIAIQILKSLTEAHAKGIIHRDLKPANVFIADVAGERDYVKVLDFGIAKSLDESQDNSLTATGQVMCSPHYVAPERVKEHVTVPASDLYSLGVMMIELLEGKPPYDAETPMMLAVKHLGTEPVPMSEATASAPFATVIARACSKPLSERYQSAAEMLDDLQREPSLHTIQLANSPNKTSAIPLSGNTASQAVSPSSVTGDLERERKPRALIAAIVAFFIIVGAVAAFVIVRSAGGPAPAPVDESTVAVAAPAAPEPALAPVPSAPVPPETETGPSAAQVDAAVSVASTAVYASRAEALARSLIAANAQPEAAPESERRTARAPEPVERSRPRPEPESSPPSREEQVAAAPRAETEPEPEPEAAPAPEAAPEPEPEEPRRRIRTNVAPIQ
jgi:serine/threonine-protein kinase